LPTPFLGTAVIGSGGRTAAVDAYGNLVDLRAPGPAGAALVAVSAERQVAGTVTTGEAIVARAQLAYGRTLPLWRADSVRQRYVPGTNVLRTVAHFGGERVIVTRRIGGRGAVRADRRWLARARTLGAGAPGWALAMYKRSLLALRALTDRHTGAVAAGARDGWAYVWPRDASAAAIALAAAGYGTEASRIARFLIRLDLDAAARFDGTGAPVPGRSTQGDAAGWVVAAARAAGLQREAAADWQWRSRADYQEGDAGDYLGNTIAATADESKTGDMDRLSAHRRGEESIVSAFGMRRELVREAGNPGSGLDAAAAWAIRPFPLPALFPAARRTLLELIERRSRFGLVPSEHWHGGDDPWTAPTAWAAWALAALAREDRGPHRARSDRRSALRLMSDLRRAATPLGLLPERVDAQTGLPTSTTPLAWSHAFAILALRELWPGRAGT
jgi:glucoamylase